MVKEVTAQALEGKLKTAESSVHIIDVREEDEVAMGKIPQATHIPLGDIPNRLDAFKPSQSYYLICRSGGRSGRACEYLSSLGYDVTNVTGGMLDWEGDIE